MQLLLSHLPPRFDISVILFEDGAYVTSCANAAFESRSSRTRSRREGGGNANDCRLPTAGIVNEHERV